MKIGIIGIGATGGYISSILCKSKENVYIIAKGETLNVVKNNGITLESEVEGNFVAVPTLVTEDAHEAGIMDIVFVCVKGCSLKAAARAISPMVDNHTLVIPIVNDVDAGSQLYSYLEKGKIAESAIYISSKVEATGIIKHTSKNNKIVISSNRNRPIHKRYLEKVYNILSRANILCEVRKDAGVAA
jgi:2-dehydropantoate 2-reductase